ncbi:MAG: metallopeptidase TldD-related protein [Candidatus Avelusimicrobium sp.]|uniref:metallopeptidase TldD-related protein n=1 Tax=Candidatus Avelusimicrobium sp. TaxID=3048833 RepID=UPI003F0BB9EB
MKHLASLFFFFIMLAPASAAEQNCKVSAQEPIKLLSAELKRGFKTFKKQNPPVYYMAYTYIDAREFYIPVADGGVVYRSDSPFQYLDVQVRVGSPALDNTRNLKNANNDYAVVGGSVPAMAENGSSFTAAAWRLTQRAVERAQKDYGRVQADVQAASQRMDDSPDFVLPPKSSFCRTAPEVSMNLDKIEKMLLSVSRAVQGNAVVLDSLFVFSGTFGHRYFVDSQGTQLKTPLIEFRLTYSLSGKTADGLEISRFNSYDMLDESGLPSEEQLLADVKQSLRELEELSRAPLAEPMTVPAILKNRAMGVFVHEVLGHRMEGHRQKEDSFGRTFTSKIGQTVTAPFISVVDDATLQSFNGEPLRGFYEYDDEGVKSQPVVMIENGVLKNFLMSSSPIKGFPVSNGHGRRGSGKRAVARMGNTRVIASETVPYNELEKMLVEEINRQGKPYGFIVEDLSGGFTMTDTGFPQVFKLEPKYVYRVYPDGKKEVIRGADLVGTPLVSFSQILAAADDDGIFNGNCGAESGWVPVSAIAPSVLFKTLEFEHTAKSAVKPPVLPPPFAVKKGDKK